MRSQAWAKCTLHLRDADAALTALAAQCADHVAAHIEERKVGARRFAAEVLSLKSKWLLAKSHLPWGDSNEHSRYVATQFQQLIMSDEDLRQSIASATTEYAMGVKAIENRLLTSVRADIAGFPPDVVGQVMSEQAIRARSRRPFRSSPDVWPAA